MVEASETPQGFTEMTPPKLQCIAIDKPAGVPLQDRPQEKSLPRPTIYR